MTESDPRSVPQTPDSSMREALEDQEARTDQLENQLSRLRYSLSREWQLRQKADKPTRAEKWASRADTWTAPVLRACVRVCTMASAVLGVVVLGLLAFAPSRIPVVIDLIGLIISSGSGFAVPAVVLAALLPRLIRSFVKEGE